jgi:hypothetical protein
MKATTLLKNQHREVRDLFKRIQKADDGEQRRALLDDIADKLRAHMTIEEEIFYPAVRDGVGTKKVQEMVPEAYEEHHVVKLVLDELPRLDTEDERFEAKMTVLEELIEHHDEEEERSMFKAADRLGAEQLESLGEEMRASVEEQAGSMDEVAAGADGAHAEAR